MDPYAYQTFRIVYEATSAIICFILVRFMLKPYQLTKESRYLGLPLGFAFLGVTYALAAFVFYNLYLFGDVTIYLQLILRSFAFVFLAATYFFSRQNVDNKKLWNTTLSILVIAFLTLFLLVIIPDLALPSYQLTSSVTRVFNLICLVYICAHTLRSYIEGREPETRWIPFGYIFFAISQFALIVYAIDQSMAAWWGGLAIRWAGLAIFLIISCRSFYCTKKGMK